MTRETSTGPAATGVSVPATDSPRNAAFDLLRIISIAGVVSIHTFGGIVSNESIAGTPDWWLAKSFSAGFVWAVPVFVMLSGALNLGVHAHRGGPAAFYRRRVQRMLPALVVWTIVYLVVIRWFVLGQTFGPGALAKVLVDATVYPHLYFLWLILGLVFVAPVLAAFLGNGGDGRAVVFASTALAFTILVFLVPGVMAIAGAPRPIHLGALTMWLPYVGYFLAGYATTRLERVRGVLLAAMIVVGLALISFSILQVTMLRSAVVLNALDPPGYLGIGTVILSICIFSVVTSLLKNWTPRGHASRLLTTMADASFGVYLVHMIVLLAIHRVWEPYGLNASWLAAALAFVVILTVSFVVSIMMNRIPVLRSVF